MSYRVAPIDELGFSLRPPKWLRKLKPGKILIPVAGVAASFLIPGVGGALVKGASLLLSAGKQVAKGSLPGLIPPITSTPIDMGVPLSSAMTAPPSHRQMTESPHRPAGMSNDLLVPALIGAGVLVLLASSRRRG